MKQLDALVQQYESTVLEYWHWLHAHPELSGEEKESAAYIAAALRRMGLEPIEGVGGYGVVALIEGKAPGKCVGLRADFDALSVEELTDLPFASQYPGKMHACGHDAHTAMLLGVAHVLTQMRDQFNGTVKLIFQPSEENSADSGAVRMIADGVLENPKVDAIFGQHVSGSQEVGEISLRGGAMTAASDRFFIKITGKSCHASRPDKGIDAITISAQIISALQNIISRTVSPFDNSVISIGKIVGGTRYNVGAETCEMEGTCRNLNPEVRDVIPVRMEGIIKGIAEGMGAEYDFRYIRGHAPMITTPEMADLVFECGDEMFGRENVKRLEHAGMGGEDFAFFLQKVPGAYYWLGVHEEGTPRWPAHNGHFVPAEASLKLGVRFMATIALKYLKQSENA